MDQRIYGRLARNDYGVYATRRYPKGQGRPGENPGGANDIPLSSNPITITLHFSTDDTAGAIAPHATVIRWRYTVPKNRRARVETAQAGIYRTVTTTGTTLSAGANVQLQRAGTPALSTSRTVLSMADITSGTAGASEHVANPGPIELFEGDELTARTGDANTGGAVSYHVNAIVVEYDALERPKGAFVADIDQSGEPGFAPAGAAPAPVSTRSLPLVGFAKDYFWRRQNL